MSGGGLGEALAVEEFDFTKFGVRVLFDLSFFIIITIIGWLRMVLLYPSHTPCSNECRVRYHRRHVLRGTRALSCLECRLTATQLRDEKYHVMEMMESECFICR